MSMIYQDFMKYFKKNFRKQVEGDEEAMHVAAAVTGKRSPRLPATENK